MPGPKNSFAKNGRPEPEQLRLTDWYAMPGADLVTRRRQVFGLLGWYHHRVVLPNLGLRGMLRRGWARVFGLRMKLGGKTYPLGYINLVSPWMSIDIKAEHREEILAAMGEGPKLVEGEPAE